MRVHAVHFYSRFSDRTAERVRVSVECVQRNVRAETVKLTNSDRGRIRGWQEEGIFVEIGSSVLRI